MRYLSDDERTALLAACKASDSRDLYAFVLFALTTGARKGEIEASNGRSVDLAALGNVPQNQERRSAWRAPDDRGCALLASRKRDCERVCSPSTSRRHGTRRLPRGDNNFRFHDLRHTWLGAGAERCQPGRSRDAARSQGAGDDVAVLRTSVMPALRRLVDRLMGDVA